MPVRKGRQKQPDGPTELSRRSWWEVLKRTVRQFGRDNLTDWAAALTYYGVLSIFPGLVVLTALLGLLGPGPTQTVIDNINQVVPGQGGNPRRRDQGAVRFAQPRRPGGGARAARRAVVGVRVRRRVHAGGQRDLRHAGRPSTVEGPAAAARVDDRHRGAAGRVRAGRRGDGHDRAAARRPRRARPDRRAGVGDREVAGDRGPDQPHVRAALLGGPQTCGSRASSG